MLSQEDLHNLGKKKKITTKVLYSVSDIVTEIQRPPKKAYIKLLMEDTGLDAQDI